MKILLVHNRYKQAGGEDSVFLSEGDLLLGHGHQVDRLIFDNSVINTFLDMCRSGIKSIYNPDSARALKARIKDFCPDVIHVHNFLPIASPSVFLTAKKLGIPVVLTLHNYRLICPSATLFYKGEIYEKSIHSVFPLDAIWKGVYRNSRIQTAVVAVMTAIHHIIGTWKNKIDCYISLTRFAKSKFEESILSLPAAKLFVKPNFVKDCGRGSSFRKDYFLFVGRLTEEKGIHTLLKAAELSNFKLIILGEGPLQHLVESATRKSHSICYLGVQPKDEVIRLMKNCRALIFPSIWYEGLPVTILEAFSTCTPVIASNLGSMHEVVQDRVNGLHFEAGNENDLVSKVNELSNDKTLARNLSESARLSYLDLYTPSNNYNQLLEIYDSVIDQRVKGSRKWAIAAV